LHHKIEDSNGNYFCHTPHIEHTIFKNDRVLYLIQTTGQNIFERLRGRWHSELPYNVDIRDLTCDETLENLSAACNRVVSVVRSKRGTNLFYAINRLDSPDGIPSKVLYSKIIQWYPTSDHTKTPWAAGVTEDRKATWFNFEDIPHILIAGSTKSGKSNHINAMIATMVTMNTPRELRLLLIDNKGGIEFTHWQGIKHALRPMIKNVGEVLPALQFARSLMERRLERFESIRAKNLMSFNSKVNDDQRLPRIVIIIDEMATLLGLGDLTTAIQNELRVLTSQGRAVGVHIIVCTQHSSADVLPGWVKTNLSMRIAGKMPSHHASMTIIDSATAATLADYPGRMVFALGRNEVIAQSPYISDEEIARSVTISMGFASGDDKEFYENPAEPVKEKFSQYDLIALALSDFEGKLTPIRMHDKLGNEIVTLRKLRVMVDQVIDRGGVVHDGLKYKLRKDRKSYILIPEHDSELDTDEDTSPVEVVFSSVGGD
jgi:hypothetical protein